jgi:hypothetical protein
MKQRFLHGRTKPDFDVSYRTSGLVLGRLVYDQGLAN